MIFWSSIFLSLLCIFKTKKENRLNFWDALFLTSSWQMFNMGIWQKYLSSTQVSDPYQIASITCAFLTISYLLRRGLEINLKISVKDVREYLLWVGTLLVILIPIGFFTGFLTWNPKLGMDFVKRTILDYFIFVAITEELVFRGLIFGLMKRVCDDIFSLIITTALFAVIFSHITSGGNFPNWPYVGMAFLAGGAYGISYYRTENILVPIMIHGTVDSIWRIFLS